MSLVPKEAPQYKIFETELLSIGHRFELSLFDVSFSTRTSVILMSWFSELSNGSSIMFTKFSTEQAMMDRYLVIKTNIARKDSKSAQVGLLRKLYHFYSYHF